MPEADGSVSRWIRGESLSPDIRGVSADRSHRQPGRLPLPLALALALALTLSLSLSLSLTLSPTRAPPESDARATPRLPHQRDEHGLHLVILPVAYGAVVNVRRCAYASAPATAPFGPPDAKSSIVA